jgi:DNA-binding transcriptional LysR family regulator
MDLSADGVIDAVATGGVEFGVGMEGAQQPEVDFRPLRQDPFVLVCRRDHPLAAGRGALRWRDLEGTPLVGVSRRSGNRLILDRALLPRGISPSWRYEAEHLSTSLGFVEAGLGVAVVPRLALPRGAHPVLVARPLVDPLVERATGLVLRRGGVPAPAARALLDLLTERLAAGQKPWTGRRRQRRGQAERSD